MTRPELPAACVPNSRHLPAPSGGPLTLIGAAVAAVTLGLVSLDASALALGQINVQSSIGEPLRAEINVTEISPGEADGMRVNIGSAEAYGAAGVAYNQSLADVRAALQRRPDGRYVIRLTSTRSFSDPFVDLLLEANWGAGRIVRDYTLLLDPPARPSTATAIAPTLPQISPAPARRPLPETARRPRQSSVAPVEAPRAAAAASAGGQLTVQSGDTAYKIASNNKPAGISLDQMLVALLRTNPSAFVDGNVNRMRAGAVIDLPSAAQAEAVTPDEARRTVVAQSRDFSGYRRRLAENAPATQVAGADRQASGRLQANVEDRNAASPSADRLTIAQGGSARAAENKLAQDRQARQRDTRVAELQKNITELNSLISSSGAQGATAAGASAPAAPATGTTPAATTAPTAPAGAAPTAPATAAAPTTTTPSAPISLPAGVPSPLPSATPAPATPASPATTVTSATPPGGPLGIASAPSAGASAPIAGASAAASAASGSASTPAPAASAATPPKPVTAAKPPPAPQRSFFDTLFENPIVLAAIALIVLLIGFLAYRVFGRKKRQDTGDSVFLESRLPKDSFFGATGGASVDTKNTSTSGGSSMSYSPSQLDAGDVDPVAEADVYLAYGRDLQAEEILREALRVNPGRTAIHLKLLEIHAKRRDLRAYEALAADVQKLTGGTGTEWNRAVEMGRELDPGNPLYESGLRSATTDGTRTAAAAGLAAGAAAAALAPAPAAAAVPPPPAFVPSVMPLDFDLDLDDSPATAPTVPSPLTASLPLSAARGEPARAPDIEPMMDFDQDLDTTPGTLEAGSHRASSNANASTAPAPLRPQDDSGFIDFDMTAMSGLAKPAEADTDTVRGALDPAADEGGENPHAIKLSLARELQALGDIDGARSLAEEVEAESTGELKAEAKLLLGQLH